VRTLVLGASGYLGGEVARLAAAAGGEVLGTATTGLALGMSAYADQTTNKLLVGVAMVPRGEVGLIFAQIGLAAGAITSAEFGALMLMVLATTFVTPPVLGRVSRSEAEADRAAAPGDGGIDDLVSGTAARRRRRKAAKS